MLANVHKWITKHRVAIDPDIYPELMTDLRLASADEEMRLDKKEWNFDLLDALRLSMRYYVS